MAAYAKARAGLERVIRFLRKSGKGSGNFHMRLSMAVKKFVLASALACSCWPLALWPAASDKALLNLNFSDALPGTVPSYFPAMVGNWLVGEEDGNRFYMVNGDHWKRGEPSADFAPMTKLLWGDRY